MKYSAFLRYGLLVVPAFFLTAERGAAQSAGAGQPAASYAPGARSSTSSNTMLDSVVGNRNSPVKNQAAASGTLYHVSSDGTISDPQGRIIVSGCVPQNGDSVVKARRINRSFGAGRRGKGFESVIIGVSDRHTGGTAGPAKGKRHAILNASFGPSALYIVPQPCEKTPDTKQALTLDAAASLAGADGNAYALAGNRDAVKQAVAARSLSNGDILLTDDSPSTSPAAERQP